MTPDELRKAVATALEFELREGPDACADTALAVVREALREPTMAMEKHGYDTWCDHGTWRDIWRAMFAKSALGGGDE
jgi:hypothetical protein